jgi:rod shape-determining protein MreD
MPVTQQLLKPVRLRFILFTFFLGLILAFIPWDGLLQRALPDFVALLLLYWGINHPRRVGVGWAFTLGLMLDIADGTLFGQHGVAYCLTTYIALSRGRQLAVMPLGQQAMHVCVLLLLNQGLMAGISMLAGGAFPGWAYFLNALTGALIWWPMSQLLLIPQRTEKPTEIQ